MKIRQFHPCAAQSLIWLKTRLPTLFPGCGTTDSQSARRCHVVKDSSCLMAYAGIKAAAHLVIGVNRDGDGTRLVILRLRRPSTSLRAEQGKLWGDGSMWKAWRYAHSRLPFEGTGVVTLAIQGGWRQRMPPTPPHFVLDGALCEKRYRAAWPPHRNRLHTSLKSLKPMEKEPRRALGSQGTVPAALHRLRLRGGRSGRPTPRPAPSRPLAAPEAAAR